MALKSLKSLGGDRTEDTAGRDDKNIEEFEHTFLKTLISKYDINPTCLIYDATNFFTYIDTNNEKATVAQRGHSKEKRNDLRIVGLSMMFSREDEIPLFYETYSGNTNDTKQFACAIQRLKDKYYEIFNRKAEVTLVFDRGNNSEANIESISSEFQYVGGLKMNQCRELCDIPKSHYENAVSEELCGTSYYRTKKNVFGKMHTVVITENPKLEKGQLQGIKNQVEKCIEKMEDIDHLSVRPLYCWTVQKIKVHIFCCVMAVRLCCILKKELSENGVQTGINEMLNCLSEKKQYVHYYQQKKGLKKVYSLSEPNERTDKMMEILNLTQYEMKS